MKFNYQARTEKGEVQSGVVEASSREAALAVLQKYGLYVTLLEEAEVQPFYAKRIKFFERVSSKDLVLFSRQLSILFKSKVPLVEALEVIASQTKNQAFKEKIFKIAQEVEGGSPFSQALSLYPDIFSSFYISMIKAGEAAGKLSESLNYLADHLEREYHLTSRIRGALIYPAMVLFVSFAVLGVMMFFVIPHLSKVLTETGAKLPAITEFIINFSIFLKKGGWLLIFLFLAILFGLYKYYKTKEGKNLFDKLFLKIPLLGPLLKMISLSRFAENLSTLISGGLPITESLEIVASLVGNEVYRKAILETKEGVGRGEPISSILIRSPEIFPPVFTQMILVGERTGTLDKTLLDIVSFYQKEVERTIENLLNILEPLLIIFLGVVVGGLMASVLLPLYRIAGV